MTAEPSSEIKVGVKQVKNKVEFKEESGWKTVYALVLSIFSPIPLFPS